MIFLPFLASLGAIANRAAGEDNVWWFSGKLWNVAFYTIALIIAGYPVLEYENWQTWLIWLSIPVYWWLRQEGRGVASAAQLSALILVDKKGKDHIVNINTYRKSH